MSTTLIAATAVAIDFMNAAVKVSEMIQRAQMEGRSHLTVEDWAALEADQTAAFDRLTKARAAARERAAAGG